MSDITWIDVILCVSLAFNWFMHWIHISKAGHGPEAPFLDERMNDREASR